MTTTKIILAGIGGVGGYFGGVLAKHYEDSGDVEICFYARGQHLKEIQANGLKVIKGGAPFIAKPKLATDNPAEIGRADLIVVCTKSYDLETVIRQLKPCIDQHTLLLPLLNGVDSKEKIKNLLPGSTILDGCVYIVSRLKQAGVIENTGNIQTLYFGLDNSEDPKLKRIESLFKNAGIEAMLSPTISSVIWEKFIFISPTATATSYFDTCIGEVVSEKHLDFLTALINEVKQVAKAKNIIVPEDITEKTIHKLKSLPFETTSSMHSDFKSRPAVTELESLTGYVVGEGQKYNIETPTYVKAYTALKKRSNA